MSWKVIDYGFSGVKIHIVHDSVSDIVIRDVTANHHIVNIDESKLDVLSLDPGGMIMLDGNRHKVEIDGLKMSIRTELVMSAIDMWGKKRFLGEHLQSGEQICKVYFSKFLVIVVPLGTYNKIESWLKSKESDGVEALAEVSKALKGFGS